MATWKVELQYIEEWLEALPDDQYADVMAAIKYLKENGPTAGRPFIDRIHHGKYHNLKELRPTDSAEHIRILFIFDPRRNAIMLLGGDKSGNWKKWYKKNIPLAEDIYEDHLKTLDRKQGTR